ncbi:hypothetical protein ACA910_020652 [Epithemia clementina (nom. ined.)]
MDSVVQLIRNALCIVKSTGFLYESFPALYDSTVLPHYYDLPEPLNETTPLEFTISFSQAYVTFSLCPSGTKLIHTSYGKYVRVQRILFDEKTTMRHGKTTDAHRLVQESLLKEAKYALRSMFIGFLLVCIGSSFFILATNSIHITETGLNGGIEAVIHALIVNELALVPLLFYMWEDFKAQMLKSSRMKQVADQITSKTAADGSVGGSLKSSEIDLATFEALTDWLPFWDAGISIFDMKVPDGEEEEKLVAKEIALVQSLLEGLTGVAKDTKKDDDAVAKLGGKSSLQTTAFLHTKSQALLHKSRMTTLEGYREFVFFVLNAVAVYSYMVSIVIYYYSNMETQPFLIRSILCFGMDNAVADWYANFWGDVMWTIEPVIALSTTAVFASMNAASITSSDKSKVKSD